MSDEQNIYSPRYIQAWTVLTIALGLVFFCMFVFGNSFLHLGHIVWALLRWICRPII